MYIRLNCESTCISFITKFCIAITAMYRFCLLFALLCIGFAAAQIESVCPNVIPFDNFEIAKVCYSP